jgi:hypothetical protein
MKNKMLTAEERAFLKVIEKERRPLTDAEILAAISVPATEYPQDMPCMLCHFRWMQHKGTLCPKTPGGFDLKNGRAVLPTWQFYTTFIPDVAYMNPDPDFDVV